MDDSIGPFHQDSALATRADPCPRALPFPTNLPTPRNRHVLKTPQEYARDTGGAVPQLKKYFKHSNIPDIVQAYPLPGAGRRGAGGGGGNNTPEAAQEKEARRVFTHFVIGLLNPNPWKRWTPKQVISAWT